MDNIWPIPPDFVDGMHVSASGHLNALRASTSYLLGLYQGGHAVWARPKAPPGTLPDGWRRLGMWYGRKRGDDLAYSMDVKQDNGAGRTIRFYVNDTILTPNPTVAAGSGTVTVSGARSLSSLTNGAFYRLAVDITGGAIDASTVDLTYLRETLTVSYPALHAFDTGTPTAAQWQGLTTTASYLHDQLRPPAATLPRRYLNKNDTATYTATHRTGTLYYRVRFRPPYVDDDRSFSMFVSAKVNGATVALLGGMDILDAFAGPSDTTLQLKDGRFVSNSIVRTKTGEHVLLGTNTGGGVYTGCTRGYGNTMANSMGEYTTLVLTPPGSLVWGDMPWDYFGTVDVSGLGLSGGADYKLQIVTDSTTYKGGSIGEVTGLAEVVGVSEQADDLGVPGWWDEMPAWAHADTVGATGMQPIRDNLDALANLVTYYNYPVMRQAGHLRWGVRRRRWLHFRCEPASDDKDDKLEPTLIYDNNGRQEAKLDYKPNEWLKHDLDGVKGLFVGDRYELQGVTYALEDDEL